MRVLCLIAVVFATAAPAAFADDPASRARAALALETARQGAVAAKAARRAAIEWEVDYKTALGKSHKLGLPILCVVVPDSDEARDALLSGPLADPAVVALSKKFVCVRLSPQADAELVKKLGAASGPSFFVASPSGTLLDSHQGSLKASEVAARLKKAID